MKIFMTATSLALSYGGPAICVPRLARALAEAGADVSIWSANGKHSKTFGSEGVRTSTGENFQQSIARFGRPDIIHDNGLWLLHNHEIAHYARERAIPRIVSLHGMLEPWARKFKRFKKGLAWHLYQRRDLQIAGALHAASKEEAGNLSRIGITAPIVTIPFGADALPRMKVEEAWRWKEARASSGRRKVLFLGRLHPVKGLPNLIEAWANLRPENWQLVLAGPDEDNYRTQLEKMVAARQLQKSIRFLGPVSGETKTNLILGADLFVLPSFQENFGMAAAEALAGGVPAITTTEAPWSMLPSANAGWHVAPTVECLMQALAEATGSKSSYLSKMGLNAHRLMTSAYSWGAVAARFLEAYGDIVGHNPIELAELTFSQERTVRRRAEAVAASNT